MSTLLVLCILCVCAFEFINGFHDTANAVARIQYDSEAAKAASPSPKFQTVLDRTDAAIKQLTILSKTVSKDQGYGQNSFEVRLSSGLSSKE